MNTTLTVESLYELFIEKLSQKLIWPYYEGGGFTGYSNQVSLDKPRTSWKLKIINNYDVEQRYKVSIHLYYTIEKYDKPKFKKDVYTRKK
jgi:hypothetical protein